VAAIIDENTRRRSLVPNQTLGLIRERGSVRCWGSMQYLAQMQEK
jgi:hypothetical protein